MDFILYQTSPDIIVKTIYDPCPAGFRMPGYDSFTGFSRTGGLTNYPGQFNVSGDWDNGWHFYNKLSNPDATIFFPTTGIRMGRDGLDQNNMGYYQTAIPAINGGLRDLAFGERTLQPLNSNWNYRQRAVRPVLDE